jgi:hypothetical protein
MVDLDRFLRTVVEVRNESGGRGYDRGVRTFSCPFCGDDKGRGWLGVTGWGAGCFNAGCDAEPSLTGGAVEWARQVLKLRTRAEAWGVLTKQFGGARAAEVPFVSRGEDFCNFPETARLFSAVGSPMQDVYSRFVLSQWDVRIYDSVRWGLRWCPSGPYALRVVIPVSMGGRPVGFQARTIRPGTEPKYLTSSNVPTRGRSAECGRPAAAMLFNADALRSGEDALLVEGAGDVMGWHAAHASPPAVGLLGVALTSAKLAVVALAATRRIIVALDAHPDARRRALGHVEDLTAWGVDACLGEWVGGKDAGSGASLVLSSAADTVAGAVRARLVR